MSRHEESEDQPRADEPAKADTPETELPAAKPPQAHAPATRTRPGPRNPGSRSTARRRRPWHQHSTASLVLAAAAILVAVVFSGGSILVYMKYRSVWDGINRVDVSADLKGKLPPIDPNAMNLLLIGSDSRSGANGRIGGSDGIDGARSDTIMVLHVAPGARQVDVLSFPRDSVVPILSCAPEAGASGQTAQPGQVEQINSTFAYGGPGCLWKTIEETTGIHINDFIELDFTGFERAIDALGGVTVCLPEAVNDPMSGLDLPAGKHHVSGKLALAFWRTREDLGEGDDPQRIQRDQFLMASMLQGIEHSGLLHSPGKMLSVIDALTGHHDVTTDESLSPSQMLRIGEDLRGISTEQVQFVTVPWTAYVNNSNWVQWVQPQADNLFASIAHDTRLPSTKSSKHGKAPKKAATLKPSQVQVAVYNGTTTAGLAADTASELSQRGFDVIGQAADAATDTYTTSVIDYAAAADLAAAQTLEKQIGGPVTLQADPELASPTLQLILGSSFTSVKSSAPAASTSPNTGLENIASTYGGINGSVNICSDKSAFSGPDGS
jgi:LCP family protein required for cell wall assembly